MPASATSFLLWWGLRLSLVAGCLAVVLRSWQQQQQQQQQKPLSFVPLKSTRTICYDGIRPSSSSPTIPDACMVVDLETGLFRRDIVPRSELGDYDVEERKGYVLPGLWDGHGHLLQYGEFLHSVDLFGSGSAEDARERVVEYLNRHPGVGGKGEWVRGVGWDQMVMGEMPTAAMLEEDERLKGKYIMLDRVDVHCTWVSQAVLDLLPPDLPIDVPGGEIVRKPGMGVFCDNAMDMVVSLWPKPTATQKRAFIASAMTALHKVGLVGMHDAGVLPSDLALYHAMSQEPNTAFTLRVYAMLECPTRNTFCPDLAPRFPSSPLLTLRSVKLFADGALGSWGSAMLSPYSDRPTTSGSLLVNASTLTALTKQWSAAGYQVNIHAIGDRANRLAIDAILAALAALCPGRSARDCQTEHRFRIEHAQIIHPDDQKRMHDVGIIPSIQPTHATSDMAYAEDRLGPERTADEAYRMRSLLDLKPVLGSDFPVEPPSPLEGMYAAVTRRSPRTGRGKDGGKEGWYTGEALELEEALGGFLEGAARGAFLEGTAGRIGKGRFADWIVLPEEVEGLGEEELREVKVGETWVGGRMVFDRADEEGGL